ncbi:extracellular solute-binding protein [Variovorax paradoxus]|uniref:extracellular solute-binding protein n=1 Tax=Variovorax paradoxus TaxID=34073 RepID=UPI0003A0E639|nr:extracellular solute-binding protein [Variovorax paradoxus]
MMNSSRYWTAIAIALSMSGSGAIAQPMPDLKGQKMTTAEFGGSFQIAIRDGWVKPFETATGVRVQMDSPNPKAKLKGQVDAGNTIWDVYTSDASFIQLNCGILFEKVDVSRFVAAGIDKRFVTNECGVPTAIVGYVFAYRQDKFSSAPPTTWADFFDLKKYPGKRAIFNSPTTGIFEVALLADGVPAAKLYPLDLDRAFRKLEPIKSTIVWTQSTGGLTDALVNNQVDLSLSLSGRVYAAAKAGVNVGVVKDQQILTWDQNAVVKGSRNKAAAEAYLQFIAQPEQQARMTELTSYAFANSRSKPQVDELVARFLPSKERAIFQDQDWWSKNFEAVNQRFVAWQSK